MKLNAKDILRPALTLFLICLFVTLLLAGTNLLTKDRIAEQSRLEAENARRVVLPEATEFAERGSCYVGSANGSEVGYVFETSSKGYGGDVRVMTGIDTEGNITGVVILEHEETPGLGANAEKPSFTDQFKQPAGDGLTLVKNRAPNPGEVEALTGASFTSNAVANAVNEAIEQYHAVKGGA